MSQRWTEAEAAIANGIPPVWLLSITLIDGRVYRCAPSPLRVVSRELAGTLVFEAGLVATEEFKEELDAFALSGVGSFSQVRIDIVVTDSLAALQADWLHLSAARAELAYVWSGQAWEDRQVVIAGATLQAMEIGVAGQISSFTLEAASPASSAAIGAASQDMGVDWPDTLLDLAGDEITSVVGIPYVFVIGDPYRVPAIKVGKVGTTNRLILCGHAIPGLSGLSSVQVFEDGVAAGSFVPQSVVASGGQAYTYVDSLTVFASSNGAYTWDAVGGGVAASNDGTKPALRADGVLRWLLTQSGLRIDTRSMQTAYRRLAEWNVGVYLDKQATAIDVVRDRLVPVLPIVELVSGDGTWFAYVDPGREALDGELTVGQQLVGRIGRVTVSDTDVILNDYSARWGYDPASDTYAGTVTLGPTNSTLCYLSAQLYGTLADDVIDLSQVRDASTALRVLVARAARLALPRRSIEYVLSMDSYPVGVGWVGLLHDAELGIDGVRAVCVDKTRGALPEQITLALIDTSFYSRVP